MSFISEQLENRIGRRQMLQLGGLAGASLFAGGLLAGCGGDGDNSGTGIGGGNNGGSNANAVLDTLNFALNLEYLEAEYYLRATGLGDATNGGGLSATQTTGLGTQGTVTGGRAVTFSSTTTGVGAYAREIAVDELNHVLFLRNNLGTNNRVARPAINFTDTFIALGNAIGVSNFDPFANETNFLLGAYVFEDVGVTAYKGAAAALVSNSTFLTAAAGILAVEAYHSGAIRAVIAGLGSEAIDLSNRISNVRDQFAGSEADQGVGDTTGPNNSGVEDGASVNLVPTDGDSIAFSRTAAQVLRIVYADGSGGATPVAGGFFPNGINTRTTTTGGA